MERCRCMELGCCQWHVCNLQDACHGCLPQMSSRQQTRQLRGGVGWVQPFLPQLLHGSMGWKEQSMSSVSARVGYTDNRAVNWFEFTCFLSLLLSGDLKSRAKEALYKENNTTQNMPWKYYILTFHEYWPEILFVSFSVLHYPPLFYVSCTNNRYFLEVFSRNVSHLLLFSLLSSFFSRYVFHKFLTLNRM